MSDHTPESDFDQFESICHGMDESFDALQVFDDTRRRFYDDIASFAADIYERTVKEGANLTTPSFAPLVKDVVASLMTDEESGTETIDLLSDMLLMDSVERADMLNELTGVPNLIAKHDKNTLVEFLSERRENSDDLDDFAHQVALVYHQDMINDIRIFMAKLEETYIERVGHAQTPPTLQSATLEIRKKPSEHVVDVLKIATGVFIALAVERRFRKS